MTIIPILECVGCLAPVPVGAKRCDFCGGFFNIDWSIFKLGGIPEIQTESFIINKTMIDLRPYETPEFNKSFIQEFSLTTPRFPTKLSLLLYINDADLEFSRNYPIIDIKKAGILNYAKYIGGIKHNEMGEYSIGFVDLLESINNVYHEKISNTNLTLENMYIGIWYSRNQHIKNVIYAIKESGMKKVCLLERKNIQVEPKTNEKILTFPVKNIVSFIVDEIIDLSDNNKVIKSKEMKF